MKLNVHDTIHYPYLGLDVCMLKVYLQPVTAIK